MEKKKQENKEVCMACECPCEVHTEHTHGETPGKICVSCGRKHEIGKRCAHCEKKGIERQNEPPLQKWG